MNQDSYNSNSLSFDQPQPLQSPVIHQPPQELSIPEMEDLKQQYLDELQRLSNLEYSDEIKIAELKENFNGMSIEIRKKEKLLQEEHTHPSKRLLSFGFDDDDEDYTSAITPDEPVLSTEEPDHSLRMGDEHIDTIPATESDEFINSSVENLISIPSESEGIPEHVCDVTSHDNSPPLDVSKDQIKDFSESNNEFFSIDEDSFSIDDIDYVEASPPDSELVSSEVMEIVIPEVGGIDDDILLMIEHDDLHEKLRNVNLLISISSGKATCEFSVKSVHHLIDDSILPKEEVVTRKKTTTDTGTCSTLGSDGILNDATPCVDVAIKDVSPSVIEDNVAMEYLVVNNRDVGPNPPLPTQEANATTGNAPGKPSYATATGKTSGKKANVRTLYKPGGNKIDVVVLKDSIRAVSERFANTAYGFFLGKKVAYPIVANHVRNTWGKYGLARSMFSSSTGLFSFQFSSIDTLDAMFENGPCEDGLSVITTKLGNHLMLNSYTSDMCMQSWGRSSYARVMIELRVDVELKDNIVVAMPTITREGHYTCNVRVEYEWKPHRCSVYKVFGHIHKECLKNTSAGEKKTVMKPSQTLRGILLCPKIGFKPYKEYRHVLKKPTSSFSGKKKKGVEPIIEDSNSNPFDVLNSVDNDGKFGKLRLLDNDGNPLVSMGIVEIDSELEVVFTETTNLGISTSGKDGSDKGYGTNSLLEQWRDSYLDNDDYDPYDDDMYENHDLSEQLQSICDDLDITELLDSHQVSDQISRTYYNKEVLTCIQHEWFLSYIQFFQDLEQPLPYYRPSSYLLPQLRLVQPNVSRNGSGITIHKNGREAAEMVRTEQSHKKQSKPNKIEHEIAKIAQKLDERTYYV
nr:hypothetical protein [Tanacetum cinerariifolium]